MLKGTSNEWVTEEVLTATKGLVTITDITEYGIKDGDRLSFQVTLDPLIEGQSANIRLAFYTDTVNTITVHGNVVTEKDGVSRLEDVIVPIGTTRLRLFLQDRTEDALATHTFKVRRLKMERGDMVSPWTSHISEDLNNAYPKYIGYSDVGIYSDKDRNWFSERLSTRDTVILMGTGLNASQVGSLTTDFFSIATGERIETSYKFSQIALYNKNKEYIGIRHTGAPYWDAMEIPEGSQLGTTAGWTVATTPPSDKVVAFTRLSWRDKWLEKNDPKWIIIRKVKEIGGYAKYTTKNGGWTKAPIHESTPLGGYKAGDLWYWQGEDFPGRNYFPLRRFSENPGTGVSAVPNGFRIKDRYAQNPWSRDNEISSFLSPSTKYSVAFNQKLISGTYSVPTVSGTIRFLIPGKTVNIFGTGEHSTYVSYNSPEDISRHSIITYGTTTGEIEFYNVMIEKGSSFSAYSPAPEDLTNGQSSGYFIATKDSDTFDFNDFTFYKSELTDEDYQTMPAPEDNVPNPENYIWRPLYQAYANSIDGVEKFSTVYPEGVPVNGYKKGDLWYWQGEDFPGRNYAKVNNPENPDFNFISSGGGTFAVKYSTEQDGFYTENHRKLQFTNLENGVYHFSFLAKARPEGDASYVTLTTGMDSRVILMKKDLTDEYVRYYTTFEFGGDKEVSLVFYNISYWNKVQVGNTLVDYSPAPEDLTNGQSSGYFIATKSSNEFNFNDWEYVGDEPYDKPSNIGFCEWWGDKPSDYEWQLIHEAWGWKLPNGHIDRFTTVYPNENLLRNTGYDKGLDNWSTNQTVKEIVQDPYYGACLKFQQPGEEPTANRVFVHPISNREVGANYVLSFRAKADGNLGLNVGWYSELKVIQLSSSWSYYEIPLTAKSVDAAINFMAGALNAPVYLTRVKFEKGTQATVWNTRPEESGSNTYPTDVGHSYQGAKAENEFIWSSIGQEPM